MNTSLAKLFASTIFATILLSGCKVSLSCNFKNLSGAPINVSLLNKDTTQIGVVAPGDSVVITDWAWNVIRIEQGLITKEYAQPGPPTECIQYKGWGPWVAPIIQVELRQDGNIHLICSAQNAMFPIIPASTPSITNQSK